jgi:hypothetical protein
MTSTAIGGRRTSQNQNEEKKIFPASAGSVSILLLLGRKEKGLLFGAMLLRRR